MEEPAAGAATQKVAMAPGTRLGPYEVTGLLGAGGMGEVYRARDTRLGRDVAVKVLRADFASDPERLHRLEHEARAVASLNHPHILTVHDVGTHAGTPYVVTELLHGKTLRELLERRAPSLKQALSFAVQAAQGLAAAHRNGVVHRDVKPDNLFVTSDGTLKILDFGLAKQVPTASEGESRATLSTATRDGVVMGTVAYMSPEQAQGLPVDARSDVFSFGVVLYEMLTGHHPFRRGSQIETLAAIREADPEPPMRVAPGLPPEAERAIMRCLHKEPFRRWQSMADLSAVLRDLRDDSESGRAKGVTAAAARRSRPWWWAATAAALVLAAAAGVGLYRRFAERSVPGPLELTRLTVDTGYTSDPTISADGKLVAYASDRGGKGDLDIWVQHVSGRDAARLTRDPADDWQPSLSPDGSRVVYRSETGRGGLYVVSTLGGQPSKLADGGRFPRYSPDGSQVIFLRDVGYTLTGLLPMFLVPATGGTPQPFQPGFGVPDLPGSAGPIWSPDGRHILFKGSPLKPPGDADWWVAPVAGGPAVATGAATALRWGGMQLPCAWFGSHLLFVMGSTVEGVNLYRARIGADFRVSGPPEPLTSGLGITHLASVSQDGHVVLPRWTGLSQLWSLDPEAPAGSSTPQALTHDAATKYAFGLDRAGHRLAYMAMVGRTDQQGLELRVRDLGSGEETTPTRLASAAISQRPRLSPDGAFLAWESFDADKRVVLAARTGEPGGQELCRDCRLLGFPSDGRVLLSAGPRAFLRGVAGGTETTVFSLQSGTLLDADLSWDDRCLATLVGNADGTFAIHAVSVGERTPTGSRSVEIARSDERLSSPRWSPDGDRLYYMAVHDGFLCIWARALDPASKTPRGEPIAVWHAHGNPWRMMAPRGMFSIAIARHRLVFGAVEMTGSVLMGRLPPD